MSLLVALVCCLSAQTRIPARQDRIAFHKALDKIVEWWPDKEDHSSTKSDVLALLGPPDDVWKSPDPAVYVRADEEIWCYGSDRHLSLPTLGRISFRDGRVLDVVGRYGDPPPLSVVSDSELARGLRAIEEPKGSFGFYEGGLRDIQIANRLRPFGKEKALAILSEYERLGGESDFWPIITLFNPGGSGGFRVPLIGALSPTPPQDLSGWPTYPLIFADGLPFDLCQGAMLRGLPESVAQYIRRADDGWTIKPEEIRPPDDPFPAYLEAMKSPHVSAREYEGRLLQETLDLVHNAYKPSHGYFGSKDYDRLHKEFLALGCRWDDGKQIYVRQDGSFEKDGPVPYPELMLVLNPKPRVKFDIRFVRENPKSVSLDVTDFISHGKAFLKSKILVQEVDTGNTVFETSVRETSQSDSTQDTSNSSMQSFDLPVGAKIRIILEFAGNRFESDVVSP